jgi:hypothetical protein
MESESSGQAREPWRAEGLESYDGPPPVPVEVIEQVFRPEDGWTTEYAVYIGRFDSELRRIPITTARHPEIGTRQWFPIRPDGGPYGLGRANG